MKPLLLNVSAAFAIAFLCASVSPADAGGARQRHAAHSGQHGGLLLAAVNDTLHVEGVWQEQRRFRVYLTDAFGLPVPASRVRELRLNAVDEANRVSPLVPTADGEYLEARIATQSLPAVLTVAIRANGGDEELLSMMFTAYSVEPPGFAVEPISIPGDLKGVLQAMREQVQSAIALVEAGAFGRVYEPMTHVRELLLALPPHINKLDRGRKLQVEASVAEALRCTWLMHLSGDLGTPIQNRAAASTLRDAVNELFRTFDHLVTPIQ